MSDFLASLAARTLEAEPAISPRPPARFEPEATSSNLPPAMFEAEAIPSNQSPTGKQTIAGISPAAQHGAPEPAAIDSPHASSLLAPPARPVSPPATRELPRPERRSGVPQQTPELPPPGGPATWDAALTAPAPARAEPAPRNDANPSPAPALAHRDREREFPDVTMREPVQTGRSLDPRDDRSREETLARTDRTEAVRPTPPPKPGREPADQEGPVHPAPRAAASPQERFDTEVVRPAPPRPEPKPADQEARALPTLRTVSRQERFDPGDAMPVTGRIWPASLPDGEERVRRPADSSPPTIQVTIGRVEVRAPAAPPREERRAKADSAVLPLNEYLRRRKEGA